jgi:arylsulfatase A-like enzyme
MKLIALLFVTALSALAAERPHIVFMMADDMGWGQTGYRGHPLLKTPNLDAMAANGLRFERFYAANPVCSPTRAAVLTGRTNDRAGVLGHGYALRLQEKTIAQALQKAGYATGHFGKWHLNALRGPGAPVLKDDAYSPAAFGFDHYVSATNFIDMDPWLGRDGVPEKFTGESSEVIVEEALRFIKEQHAAGKSTFSIIWFGSPHGPFMAAEGDLAAFDGLKKDDSHHHGELVAMDRSIGSLRNRLRTLGIAENTLLVFNSDNGGLPGIQPATTGGLRGNKGMVYEGGLRVPGIIEWPNGIKPRITQHPAGVVDLFPTVADIVGLPQDSFVQPLDGISLKPLFAAEISERKQPMGFRFGNKAAYLDGRYKLVTADHQKSVSELYDIESDPNETKDLATEKPDVLAAMQRKFDVWNASVQASLQGADYPGGKVDPPDPESVNWFETERYRPYLAEWSDYWAYQTYFDRAGRPIPKKKINRKQP